MDAIKKKNVIATLICLFFFFFYDLLGWQIFNVCLGKRYIALFIGVMLKFKIKYVYIR